LHITETRWYVLLHFDVFLTAHERFHDRRLAAVVVFLFDVNVNEVSFEQFIKKIADNGHTHCVA